MMSQIKITKDELFEFLKNKVEAQGFEVSMVRENMERDYETADFVGVIIEVKMNLDKDKILA